MWTQCSDNTKNSKQNTKAGERGKIEVLEKRKKWGSLRK
jgi:hypothetical protein